MLTAISVAWDCGMVQTHEKVIIVDAVPPRDLQPASITWRYTENPRDAIDQVRFKHSNSWVTKCKAHALTGWLCSARSDMFVFFVLEGKRVLRVLSLQSTNH